MLIYIITYYFSTLFNLMRLTGNLWLLFSTVDTEIRDRSLLSNIYKAYFFSLNFYFQCAEFMEMKRGKCVFLLQINTHPKTQPFIYKEGE